MSVQKSGSGAVVKHCHGKNKGKVIARHASLSQALKQHAAIEASKAKRKKGK